MYPRVLITLMLMAMGSALAAQEVRLISKSSGLVIGGTLLSFDGDHYRLDTVYGSLTVNAAGVTCKGADCPSPGSYSPVIRFSGDRKLINNLLPALIEGFAKGAGYEATQKSLSPDRMTLLFGGANGRFDLHATTSAEGYVDLISEGADIALVTRPPNDAELAMSRSGGSRELYAGDRAHVLALETLVFTGPSETLPLADLANVEANLAEGPFAFGEALTGSLRGLQGPSLKPGDDRAHTLNLLSAADASEVVPIADGCRIIGHSTASVPAFGDDPLTVRVMLYTAPRRLPELGRDFLKFLDTPEAAEIVKANGLTAPAISVVEHDDLGPRLTAAVSDVQTMAQLEDLKRFTNAVQGKRRLAATFRFLEGTRQLDMPSRDLRRRLVAALKAGDFDGRTLTLAGFSDSSADSFKTSQRLARAVEMALGAHDEVDIAIAPFGNVMPVLCDDTALGVRLNRRVEVWIE